MDDSAEVTQIKHEMAQVRRELNREANGIVDNARTISDWRHYVRRYPWATLAGAAAVGFLAVPRRIETVHPDPDTLAQLAREDRLVVTPRAEAHPRKGFSGSLLTFLSSMVLRGGLAWLGQKAAQAFHNASGEEAEDRATAADRSSAAARSRPPRA